MSFNDLVKFMTQQLVRYVDQPKEARKRTKEDRSLSRARRSVKWFGLIPMAISMFIRRK